MSLLALSLLLSACSTSRPYTLAAVNAWERGEGLERSEERRLERLVIPRNAQVSFRVVEYGWADSGGQEAPGVVQVLCRVHTVDGGMVTWELSTSSPATGPVRAKWLKGLDVLMARVDGGGGLGLVGAAVLAEVPEVGRIEGDTWRAVHQATQEARGELAIASRLVIHAGERGHPSETRRYLVFEGVQVTPKGEERRGHTLALEMLVHIIDRDHRPKQKEHRAPERHDPVREPPPRALAASH